MIVYNDSLTTFSSTVTAAIKNDARGAAKKAAD